MPPSDPGRRCYGERRETVNDAIAGDFLVVGAPGDDDGGDDDGSSGI